MTLIRVDLRRPDTAGDVPTVGKVVFQPYSRRHIDAPDDGAADYIRLAEPFIVDLVNGVTVVDLAPTADGDAWIVSEKVSGGITRYVAVPDSEETLDYGDLATLDPATLTATDTSAGTPEPDWQQPVADLTQQVDALTAQVEALTTQVQAIASQGQTLTTRVDALAAHDTQQDNATSQLATQVGTLTSQVAEQDTAIGQLSARVDAVTVNDDEQDDAIGQLSTRVDTLETHDTEQDGTIAQLTTRMDTLAGHDAEQDTATGQLATQVDALATHDTEQDTATAQLTTRVDALAANDAEQDSAIEQLAAMSGSPATMRSVWRWTNDLLPTSGRITADQAGEGAAVVRIHGTNAEGGDMSHALDALGVDSTIYLQARDDADVWRRWTVTAPPDVQDSVYAIEATTVGGQGIAPSNNAWCSVALAVPDALP